MAANADDSRIDPDWPAIPAHMRQALDSAWGNGMPPLASALYARWWQLETWLRALVYVELKTKFGINWAKQLPKTAVDRQQGEKEFHHMQTPDAQNLLAYTDASALFSITLQHWDLFERALLSKSVWTGRIEELRAIRNRIGHCRRPHADDLVRLEQTLRDLNGGAFRAASAFNNQQRAADTWTDLIIDGWMREQHEDAVRLIKHAEQQYDTVFDLRYSRRPWAAAPTAQQTITGAPGFIWHATWYFRGGRSFNLEGFWREVEYWSDPFLLVCADHPYSLSVSFAAVEDPNVVANAIGKCFDAALMNLGRGAAMDSLSWQQRYGDIDPRVHTFSAWTIVDESMAKNISMFGA